ncbi:MAG: twin-arginine translocation protein TatA/E family subunit [Nocardioides sp.]|nr:twin-arginine translocation protein TatA/E family subunit [Nocardioides sp.]
MITPLIAGLGPQELVLILIVILLLFGASKLPELARGSGRALRIFKAETKGLMDDDEDQATKTPEQRELDARQKLLDDEADRIARERRDDTTA